MVDANLKLVAAIRFVWCDLDTAASARSGNILQQAKSYRVKTSNRNLIVVENRGVRHRAATAGHGCHRSLRWGRQSLIERHRRGRVGSAAVLQNICNGRIGE